MIATWSAGAAGAYLAPEELAEQCTLVRGHPWWQARACLTLALLERLDIRPPARVLDAGCGWGVTFRALERRGYRVTGLDVSRTALELLERERPGRSLVEADLTRLPDGGQTPPGPPFAGGGAFAQGGAIGDSARDGLHSPPCKGGARGGLTARQHRWWSSPAFDAVLALDVIEHLDDDRAAVAGLARLAAPGGFVIVSVPALPELYTEFDAVQDHRRRYVPETLRAAFDDTGLEVERLFWWGSWLVPLLKRQRARATTAVTAARRYNEYLRLPPWPATVALRALFAWEHGRSLAGRSTIGTSLFAVGRRRG